MPISETEVHLDPDALAAQLADDVRAGLTATPRTIPPKYFYDARGSRLFDEITRLPEYYPTRTERAILVDHAKEIALVTGARSLVELGSGTSEKTQLLIGALMESGRLRRLPSGAIRSSSASRASRTSRKGCGSAEDTPETTPAPPAATTSRNSPSAPEYTGGAPSPSASM